MEAKAKRAMVYSRDESPTHHTNQMKLFNTIAAAATITGSLAFASPALAERPGHKYIWTHATYTFTTPGMTLGGDVSCNTYSYTGTVQCSKSPSYTTAPSQYQRRLSIHVDCTDRTFDAKGDKQGWKSWNHAPNLYNQFVQECNYG